MDPIGTRTSNAPVSLQQTSRKTAPEPTSAETPNEQAEAVSAAKSAETPPPPPPSAAAQLAGQLNQQLTAANLRTVQQPSNAPRTEAAAARPEPARLQDSAPEPAQTTPARIDQEPPRQATPPRPPENQARQAVEQYQSSQSVLESGQRRRTVFERA